MTLAELIAEYRRRADDFATPPKTSDADLAKFASEGEREAATSALLLFDDSVSDGLTTIAIAAGVAVVDLAPEVFRIDGATFTAAAGGRAQPMDLVGIDAIREICDWDTRTASRPWQLAHAARTQARLWPTPSGAGTLQLAVYRTPLNALEDDDDEPEIALEHHDGLVDWMLYRGFQPKDGEEGDPQRSAEALDAFRARFGMPETADVQRRKRERRRVTTRCV